MNDEGAAEPAVGVDWREWGEASFAEARERDVPVLLSLTATWCSACHEMDRETYASPRVAAVIRDGYVPVRVDVDRHPRVRERYNMGGFPSTVFCTPAGEVLTGTTYLGPDGMKQVLDRMRETWTERGEAAGSVPRALAGDPTPAGEVTTAIEEHLAGQLGVQYDHDFGGWGTDAKFPMPRTVEFALKRERHQALSTLDVIERNLFDEVDGGFFRYATTRDWSEVEREKLLATNAALVRAYANGYLYTGDERYRETARATVDFLTDDLWTGQAVGGSLGPAAESNYYDRADEERADAAPPRRDLTVYAGDNGLAAEALLTLSAYTDDDDAREAAERILDHLEQELLDDGVVTRYRDGGETGEQGLLAEQARVAAAFCRAEQVLGEGVETARAVVDHAIETLHDDGSFRDGPATGAGLVDRPLRPIDDNVDLAEACLDLAALTGEETYREVARDTVAAFAGATERIGIQVAGYGAVAARLCRPDLVVEVPRGSDLHRAAHRIADHEKVVVPGSDDAATVRVGDDRRTATTPKELMDAVSALQ
ncbi:DUF255 domain-containing protein [Salinigranum halophilum]|uniref:DUF255 domain-containing protein n=1 Tax=Salinigranum halophilum TaxID=2565931 RepID=UPI00115DFE12|nr:DUF255 domain-containing protein [Salinigranum halophilum]